MMPLVRPATKQDLPTLVRLAKEAGYGFTSMPPDKGLLHEKLEEEAQKVFVLEYEGRVVGSSAILSHIGHDFYAFHVQSEHQVVPEMGIDRKIATLHFTQATKEPTEVGSLFLGKECRGRGWGRLLSFARFLYIASFRTHFADTVIAELRGFVDEKGHSPFWEAVGKPFFGMEFQEANEWRYAHAHTLPHLFPKHPLYQMLLPPQAQAVIRETHPQTRPALKLLQSQGFTFSHYIDLFDAGPHLFAHTDSIQAVKESREGRVSQVKEEALHTETALVSTTVHPFRACQSVIETANGEIVLPAETATLLQVAPGDKIRYLLIP